MALSTLPKIGISFSSKALKYNRTAGNLNSGGKCSQYLTCMRFKVPDKVLVNCITILTADAGWLDFCKIPERKMQDGTGLGTNRIFFPHC